MQTRRFRVALLIESSRAYGRALLSGIGNYAREHGPWILDVDERSIADEEPLWLEDWKGDGVIARIESQVLESTLRRTGAAVVDVRGALDVQVPSIDTDNRAVGEMAAEHLIARGFRSFGFCGYEGLNYSELRRTAFVAFVEAQGLSVDVYESPGQQNAKLRDVEQQGLQVEEGMARWLADLPKPVGVMACNDIRGQQIVKACREVNIPVPEAVGLVGVDNDEILCELSDPSLSSVDPDAGRIGYEAAALLHRLLLTDVRSRERIIIPPKRIVMRQSTDSPVVDDPFVAQALCLIRQRAHDNLTVDDIAKAVSLTRRTLERRFTQHVGCTPNAEIQRVRVERIAELLTTTSWTLAKIAEVAGFAHPEYMCSLFKKRTGQTPGQYRKASAIDEKRG